jgi:hypothetical protein
MHFILFFFFALFQIHEFQQVCSVEQNVDFYGYDLYFNPTYTSSQDYCCQLCQSDANCNAWTYILDSKACWLKKAIGIRRASYDRSIKYNFNFI